MVYLLYSIFSDNLYFFVSNFCLYYFFIYNWRIVMNAAIEVIIIKTDMRKNTTNIIAIAFQMRRERRFLIASCSFIRDNCSATSFVTFPFLVSIFEPSNSLTDTSNISARRINVSASGTDRFFSHLEIVCLTT